MPASARTARRAVLLILSSLVLAACGPQFTREQVIIDAGGVAAPAPDGSTGGSTDGTATAGTASTGDSTTTGDTVADTTGDTTGGATTGGTATPDAATAGGTTAGTSGTTGTSGTSGTSGTTSSSTSTSSTTGGGSSGTTGTTGTTGGTVDPGPAPGVTPDTVKIGYLVPLTGAAPIPTSWDEGANLYWDTHDIQGRDVELIIEDTNSSTTTAVQKARKLVTEDKVFTILTLDRLEVQDAVAQELEARNFPHIMIQSPTPPPANWSNTFTVSIDHTVQGRAIARFFSGELSDLGSKVGVVREETNALKPGTDAFVAEAGAKGLDVVANETVNPGSADYSGTVLRLSQSQADIVWLYMAPTVAARIISQAGAQGYTPTWFANSISWGFELMHDVTGGYMEGAYAFSPWIALSDPRADEYKAAWNACGSCNGAPDDIGLVGWAAGGVLKAALDASPALGHDAFRTSMRSFKVATGLWAPIDFSGGGSVGSSQVAVYKAVGGKWTMAGDFRGF